jgi:hypothetical protein
MQIIVQPQGSVRCLYDERIDLSKLGRLSIERASNVEPNASGQWVADLQPLAGPRLGPFPQRSMALAAERSWIQMNRLDCAV